MLTCTCCLVDTPHQADRIVAGLNEKGIDRNRISVLFPDRHDSEAFAKIAHTRPPEVASEIIKNGGMLSGAVGWAMGLGIMGWVIGATAFAIPGIGPFVAVGPFLAELALPLASAAAGGISGLLVGLGIAEGTAKHYEAKIHAGNIFIAVHRLDPEETTEVDRIMADVGATDISHLDEAETIQTHEHQAAGQA